MAFVRASQGGGGGELTPTVIWTNYNTSQAFNTNDVTLGDGISKYKYIKVIFCYSTNAIAKTCGVLVDTNEISNFQVGQNNMSFAGMCGGSSNYYRIFTYVNNVTLHFYNCVNQIGQENNSVCIPFQVIGYK